MGAIVAVLGAVICIGWLTGNTALVQIHPSLTPQQFNTALSFVLLGLSIVLTPTKISIYLAHLVGIFATATFAQDLLGVNFHIDELFLDHYIVTNTPNPGRMAPNTAICFAMSALFLLCHYRYRRAFLDAFAIFSSVTVLSLSSISLLGYVFRADTLYGWAGATFMALNTSIMFVIVAFALSLLAFPHWFTKAKLVREIETRILANEQLKQSADGEESLRALLKSWKGIE